MSQQVFTIFYSWQNDRPGNVNRNLIRAALDGAAKILAADSDVPYRIAIDQDAEGVPGLCDIPAEILRKIDNSDAVVVDLTYIGKSEDTEKHCSNPNVLFELGYAFHSIGWRRLVCVMNEAYGPTTATIFDIDHRRHAVSYNLTPDDGQTKADVRRGLAKELAKALKPTVLLGPQGMIDDSDRKHETDLSTIIAEFQGRCPELADSIIPSGVFNFRPKAYVEYADADAAKLEGLLRTQGIPDGHRTYPPNYSGRAFMPWGVFNGQYSNKWGVTFGLQYVNCEKICAIGTYPVDATYPAIDPVSRQPIELHPSQWIDFDLQIQRLYLDFAFASSISKAISTPDVHVEWTVKGLSGTRAIYVGQYGHSRDDPMGPCEAKGAAKQWSGARSEFQESWRLILCDWLYEFFSYFDRDGRHVARSTLANRIAKLDAARGATTPNGFVEAQKG